MKGKTLSHFAVKGQELKKLVESLEYEYEIQEMKNIMFGPRKLFNGCTHCGREWDE